MCIYIHICVFITNIPLCSNLLFLLADRNIDFVHNMDNLYFFTLTRRVNLRCYTFNCILKLFLKGLVLNIFNGEYVYLEIMYFFALVYTK